MFTNKSRYFAYEVLDSLDKNPVNSARYRLFYQEKMENQIREMKAVYSTEKCCPACGKYFIDNSQNNSRITCSKKCHKDYYYFKNPEQWASRKIKMRQYILKMQGVNLTDEEINTIETKLLKGICEICGEHYPIDKLHIDHDHKTNKFRGIICANCNTALGFTKENVNTLVSMAEYLFKH